MTTNFMKSRVSFCLLLLMVACGHQENSRDIELRGKMVGTWLPNLHSDFDAITFSADGNFVSQFSTVRTNGPKVLIYSGTWHVENGFWIATITNVSGTDWLHQPVGSVDRGEIIRLDEHEFIYEINSRDGNKNQISARRK